MHDKHGFSGYLYVMFTCTENKINHPLVFHSKSTAKLIHG